MCVGSQVTSAASDPLFETPSKYNSFSSSENPKVPVPDSDALVTAPVREVVEFRDALSIC